jgi:hypothetical protein
MIQSVEKKIGETTYRITPFGARKGRAVLFQLTKLLGGALSGALSGGGAKSAIAAWAASAREEDFEAVCKALEEGTQVLTQVSSGGAAVPMPMSTVFDTHFVGRYDEMLLWLEAALEVNFASFFSGSLAAGFLKEMTAEIASKPATESTGSSGGS